jgi:hypothetical protein
VRGDFSKRGEELRGAGDSTSTSLQSGCLDVGVGIMIIITLNHGV